ncbi:MAG: molybdate ABC transporter substrate-binding protein [Capsulimonadales bacterium]|nr:molybdate ABC transporter substrate-binding protein [Capsulimonadales bacterium]
MRLGAVVVLMAFVVLPRSGRAETITVAAASSLTNAMREIGQAFSRANPGTVVRFTFGSSGTLLQQIRQGAPIDVFAPASPQEMEVLIRNGDLIGETRTEFAGNRLVLIGPVGTPLQDWADLKRETVRRVALSDPASVPSGRYARETLIRRGLWNAVRPKGVFGGNVRQTLTYVANGDAAAGIVFATDAGIEPRVTVVAHARPGKDHLAIVYPAAVVRRSRHSNLARRFAAFLKSQPAQVILRRFGFSPPPD